MPQLLRIFISSPSDVTEERLRAALIIDKLAQDYRRFFTIESYRWEHEPLIAAGHFQDALDPPSEFDIVVLILWSRLGTPLPERTRLREYRGIDGRAPVTGTEWEYEDALKAARERGAPDLLAFRSVRVAPIDPRDPHVRAGIVSQLESLDAFWRRHFVDRGTFTAAYDEYRTLQEFAVRLEESLRRLLERRVRAISGGIEAAPVWLKEPFRGLQPYEFEHAPIYFGRDGAVVKATEQLAANARSGHAFLLVSGASGSGKSSLVKAGIVPRLMKPQRISGIAFLRRAVFRPGMGSADLLLSLAQAITRAGPDDATGLPELLAPGQDAAQLASHLRGVVANPVYLFAHALGRLSESERRTGRLHAYEEAGLVLLIDQLEELFTAPGIDAGERLLFVDLIAGLVRSRTVWVVATLRSDFWHRAADIPPLVALAEGAGRFDLLSPSLAELTEMIRKPAHAAGLSFEIHPETGLGLDAVLAEHAAAAPGVLPMLSLVLDKLYDEDARKRGTAVLTFASYEAQRGIEGAIATRADEVLASLPGPAGAALSLLLRALVTVGQGTPGIVAARAAPLHSYDEGTPVRRLVDAFVAARLLVLDEGEAPSLQVRVRVAHEALLNYWGRARDWIEERRADLPLEARLEADAARWTAAADADKASRLLPAGLPLTEAQGLLARRSEELPEAVAAFIAASATADAHRRETERRRLEAEEALRREAAEAEHRRQRQEIESLARDNARLREIAGWRLAFSRRGRAIVLMLVAIVLAFVIFALRHH